MVERRIHLLVLLVEILDALLEILRATSMALKLLLAAISVPKAVTTFHSLRPTVLCAKVCGSTIVRRASPPSDTRGIYSNYSVLRDASS